MRLFDSISPKKFVKFVFHTFYATLGKCRCRTWAHLCSLLTNPGQWCTDTRFVCVGHPTWSTRYTEYIHTYLLLLNREWFLIKLYEHVRSAGGKKVLDEQSKSPSNPIHLIAQGDVSPKLTPSGLVRIINKLAVWHGIELTWHRY